MMYGIITFRHQYSQASSPESVMVDAIYESLTKGTLGTPGPSASRTRPWRKSGPSASRTRPWRKKEMDTDSTSDTKMDLDSETDGEMETASETAGEMEMNSDTAVDSEPITLSILRLEISESVRRERNKTA